MGNSERRVPIIVVAGFLGAGKSTMLNHLLRNAGSTRIGLIVNDFGAINIDALLAAGSADGVVGLGNGCICCTVDDDSVDGFAAVIDRMLRPTANLDVIVVEASGLADPRTLVRMVAGLTDPRALFGGLIYVVDAGAFERSRSSHPELDHHVRIADLVVVNKIDQRESAQDSLRRVVEELNSTAPIAYTSEGVVDPAMIFDVVESTDNATSRQLTLDELLREQHDQDHRHHHHLHHDYQSVSFTSDVALDPRRLAAFLERPPRGSYRIKGWAHFDLLEHRGKFVIHAVGGRIRVDVRGWDSAEPSTSIVVIGAGLDEDAAQHALELTCGTDVNDEFGILSVTRHQVPGAGWLASHP